MGLSIEQQGEHAVRSSLYKGLRPVQRACRPLFGTASCTRFGTIIVHHPAHPRGHAWGHPCVLTRGRHRVHLRVYKLVSANPFYDCKEVSSRPRFAYPKTSYRLLSSSVVATSVFRPASLEAPLSSPSFELPSSPGVLRSRFFVTSPSSPVNHSASTVTPQKDSL